MNYRWEGRAASVVKGNQKPMLPTEINPQTPNISSWLLTYLVLIYVQGRSPSQTIPSFLHDITTTCELFFWNPGGSGKINKHPVIGRFERHAAWLVQTFRSGKRAMQSHDRLTIPARVIP